MTEQPGSPWLGLLGKRQINDPRKVRLHDAKLRLLDFLPPALVRGERDATLSREELERALEPFLSELPNQEYVSLVRFLARGLTIGRKKLGWKVAVPAALVSIPREPARFTPLSFKGLIQLRRIEEVLVSTFTLSDLSPQLLLGRMLLSAIVYGGLLQNKWFVPMLTAVNNRVRARGSLVWLDMERVWQYPETSYDASSETTRIKNNEIIISRRWFADPLSRLLIIQWLKLRTDKKILPEHLPNPYDLVKQFLRHSGCQPDEIPRSINLLIEMAGTRIGLTVPPYIAAYAEGSINAVSVPAATWTRLCTRKPVPREHSNSDLLDDEDTPVKQSWRALAYAAAPVPPGEQREILKKMRRLMAKRGASRHDNASLRKKLALLVETHRDDMCQLLHLLAVWMDYNLSPSKRNVPSSVDRYLGAIADAMLVVCGKDELLEWDAVEFQARYEQAFALLAKQKEFARATFGRFHRFLVTYYGASYLAPAFFAAKSGPAELSVDANLVSQEEFDIIKVAIGWNNPDRPRSASAAIIAAILGFRCGLRREEAQYLRLRDIQGRHKPEIVLRATPRRSLKTPAATRRLPLHVLLTEEELTFLNEWLHQFKNPDRNALLLGTRGNDLLPLPDQLLFRPIRIAMRQVTGDATLRFHHLRHSFATWLLLRLTGDPNTLHTSAPFCRHIEFSSVRIQELRRALMGNEQMGRKGAYAVASLCGHADLDTMFNSYIHLCDWFLQRELSRPEGLPVLDAETVMTLTGGSRATVFRTLQITKGRGTKTWNWFKLLRKEDNLLKSCADPLLMHVMERKISEIPFPDEHEGEPWWESLKHVLNLNQVRGKPADVISLHLGLDESKVKLWLERAEWLGSLRGRIVWDSSRYFRHLYLPRGAAINCRTVERLALKDLFRMNLRKKVYPYPPHTVVDRELALRMLSAFDKLSNEERSVVIDLANLFVKKFSLQSGALYFWETEKARKYVEALAILGIRARNIQLIDCRNNPQDSKILKQRRKHWAKELSLKQPLWKINNKSWGRKNGMGTVGVQVVNDLKGNRRVSYGFRYAMYMIAIAWGS